MSPPGFDRTYLWLGGLQLPSAAASFVRVSSTAAPMLQRSSVQYVDILNNTAVTPLQRLPMARCQVWQGSNVQKRNHQVPGRAGDAVPNLHPAFPLLRQPVEWRRGPTLSGESQGQAAHSPVDWLSILVSHMVNSFASCHPGQEPAQTVYVCTCVCLH